MPQGGRRSLLVLGSSSLAAGVAFLAVGVVGVATAPGGGASAVAAPPSAGASTPPVVSVATSTPSSSSSTPGATPAASATTPPTPATVPDLTELAGRCRSLPSGTVPPYLRFTGGFTSGTTTDPRTGQATIEIRAGVAASPLHRTAPFVFAGILLPANATSPPGRARPIDRLGLVQLWYASDRSGAHKGIRTYRNGHWTMRSDDRADTLTVQLTPVTVSFFWSGILSGERFAFVSAGPAGCGALGTDALRAGGG